MVTSKSALEANDSQKDYLVVSRLKLGKVFRSEGPRHTPEYSRVSITSAFSIRTFRVRGSVVFIQLRAEPFKACTHETDPSADFEREVTAFSWLMPPKYKNWAVCLFVPLACCFDDERLCKGCLVWCS